QSRCRAVSWELAGLGSWSAWEVVGLGGGRLGCWSAWELICLGVGSWKLGVNWKLEVGRWLFFASPGCDCELYDGRHAGRAAKKLTPRDAPRRRGQSTQCRRAAWPPDRGCQ